MSSTAMSWDDTKALARDLCVLLETGDDVLEMRRVAAANARVLQAFSNKEQTVQEAIRGLCAKHKIAADVARNDSSVEDAENKVHEMHVEKARVGEAIELLKKNMQLTEEEVAKLKAERAALQTHMSMEEQADDVPSIRNTISLFVSFSQIRWDYDSDMIAGAVMPKGKVVTPFSIDPAVHSQADVADSIWDTIERASS